MRTDTVSTIVIASGNIHKNTEIKNIIGDIGVDWIYGYDVFPGDIEENGSTYRQNAVLKARAYSDASGLPALADDSGLEVDVLEGLPGIRSNRFFGRNKTDAQKIRELLVCMKDVPFEKRTARFVCHAVLMSGERVLKSCAGVLKGRIALEPAGDRGFGYDPVFLVPETGKTLAQLDEADKNRISHRGIAMRRMREFLLRYTCDSW